MRRRANHLKWFLVIAMIVTMLIGFLQAGPPGEAVWAADELVTFDDVTANAGMVMVQSQAGAAWADYDGDGLEDLYAGHHVYPPALYRNNGDGTFSDVADEAGISGMYDRHGPTWGDYNNDGLPDLYITAGRSSGGSQFYINNGDGTFTEWASQAGVKNYWGRGRTARWGDYDKDGDLDLFVANAESSSYSTLSDRLYRNNNGGTFTDVSAAAGINDGGTSQGADWGDYNGDGLVDLLVAARGFATGKGPSLYRNNGTGTFTNVAEAAGIQPRWDPYGVVWGDYDNDGDLDFYVSYGYWGFGDTLTIVDSDTIQFTGHTVGSEDGLSFASSGGQITVSLWNTYLPLHNYEIFIGSSGYHPTSSSFVLDDCSQNYGRPSYTPGVSTGVYIWKDGAAGKWHIHWSSSGRGDTVAIVTSDGIISQVSTVDFEPYISPSSRKNYLYQNNGDGTFSDVTDLAGVGDTANTHYASWVDFDNDGDLDLYVVNHGDVAMGNQPNRLYRNNGDGTFTDLAQAVGLRGLTAGFGKCAAWADYNRDGFLDVFLSGGWWVGPLATPQKLYQNGGNDNHWLRVTLVGTLSNRQGLGAKVEIKTAAGLQYREAGLHPGGACQDSPILHFGLGDLTNVDELTVTWPSGVVDTFYNIDSNQHLTIFENESLRGVSLTIGQTASASPGSQIVFTHTLTNTGKIVDSFDLAATSNLAGWSAIVSPLSIGPLAPAENAPFTLTVQIPQAASENDVGMVTLVAISQADDTVQGIATDQVTVIGGASGSNNIFYLPVILSNSRQ